ncbi:MAG: glycosyltransferase [Candidatus Methanofastidiosum sp.]|nr:glycosyltransferase [Methanofastidiosum sp.]
MKKVVHLSIRHPLHDHRIFYKECTTLKNNNFEVYLIVPHEKNEVQNGINVVALKEYPKGKDNLLKNIPRTLLYSLRINGDLYHIHCPELVPIGIILKIFRKKIIYDVAENFPAQVYQRNWPNFLKIFVSNLFRFYDYLGLKLFDSIIAAEPIIYSRFPPSKTTLIRNVPILKMIDDAKPIHLSDFSIIYVGGLTRLRGIKELIESIESFGGSVTLLLMGKWERGYMEECAKLKGWNYTKYLGIKPLQEVYPYIKGSKIGMVTIYPMPNYTEAWPVKAFEYMACSLPTIMSDFDYWKEIYTKVAIFINPKNPEDIADKIKILVENKELREELGKKGRKLVETKYNWEKEAEKLIELYKELS